MKVGHHNALAGVGFAIRRYLVLVTVPEAKNEYAICDHEVMRLGCAAYWVSLAKEPILPTGDEDTKTVVPVPRSNLLTTETLMLLVADELEESSR